MPPSGNRESDARRWPAALDPRQSRCEKTLRQLLRAVDRDLRGAVRQDRIGEPNKQRAPIGGEIELGWGGERRGALLHQRSDIGGYRGLAHRLCDIVPTGEL